MIFFIYGADHFRAAEKLKELTDQFTQKRDKSGFNVVKLDGENLDLDRFKQEALAAPFLGEKKLLVIKNILKNKKRAEPILEFLKDRGEKLENNLIFVDLIEAEKKAQPTGQFFKYLAAQKYRWQFEPLNNFELKKWLQNYLANKKIALELAALGELIILCGNNLSQLILEIDKLVAYKNGKEIKKADVPELVKAKFDENIFNLVDAFANKDKKTALKLVSDQIKSGNHPLLMLNMIARQFKILLKISDSHNTGSFGLHPYVLKKAREQKRNFTIGQLITINQELINLESQFKSGAKNPELLFDLFIAKNC